MSTLRHRSRRGPFKKRFAALMTFPLFWQMTLIGNAMIFTGAIAIHHFESSGTHHPSFLDSLLWSTNIVTTIGFIPWVPETSEGKVTAIVLMMLGTFFLWSYMALLVSALISPALANIEKDVVEVEKELSELKHESKI